MILDKHKYYYREGFNGEPMYVGFCWDAQDDIKAKFSNKSILYEYVKTGQLLQKNFDIISIFFESHKGLIWLGSKRYYGNEIAEYSGHTTEDILEDIILNQEEYTKKLMVKNMPNFSNQRRVISISERYNILKEQNWRCNLCGKHLKFKKDSPFGEEVAHIDHIHPFSKRLTYPFGLERINERSNLQALCANCNLTKSEKKIN